jgi:sRNA-binding carbon storage regulator CsrA
MLLWFKRKRLTRGSSAADRPRDQNIVLEDRFRLTVLSLEGGVKFGIDATPGISIDHQEIHAEMQKEQDPLPDLLVKIPETGLIDCVRVGRSTYRLQKPATWLFTSGMELALTGVQAMSLNAQGNLVFQTSGGDLMEKVPVVCQQEGNDRQNGAGSYVLEGDRVCLAVGFYNAIQPLTIEPALSYSIYLDGSAQDEGFGIAVGSFGDTSVTGDTDSTGIPTSNALEENSLPGAVDDAFVTKLNASGTGLVYSTYFGSGGVDEGFGIAVDATGNAYVTGETGSVTFSTTADAFQSPSGGSTDTFVTKLNDSGTTMLYSTYLGGDSAESYGIAVNASGTKQTPGRFEVEGFENLVVGRGRSVETARADWENRLHTKFQKLYPLQDHEMSKRQRQTWEKLTHLVDVEAYRKTVSVVGREIGQVVASGRHGRVILWQGGRRDKVRFSRAPGELVLVKKGEWLQAMVARHPDTYQIRRIVWLKPYTPWTGKLDDAHQAKVERIPTIATLPETTWD